MAASADIPEPLNTAPKSFSLFPEAKQQGEIYVRLPDEQKDGWVHAHARQTILVEPQALYALWKREEAFPLWQEHVVSVTPTGGNKSHWVMGNPEDPDGKRIEFDSEITEDIPGEKIAWKSIAGDVDQSGEVAVSCTPRRTWNGSDADPALQDRGACQCSRFNRAARSAPDRD